MKDIAPHLYEKTGKPSHYGPGDAGDTKNHGAAFAGVTATGRSLNWTDDAVAVPFRAELARLNDHINGNEINTNQAALGDVILARNTRTGEQKIVVAHSNGGLDSHGKPTADLDFIKGIYKEMGFKGVPGEMEYTVIGSLSAPAEIPSDKLAGYQERLQNLFDLTAKNGRVPIHRPASEKDPVPEGDWKKFSSEVASLRKDIYLPSNFQIEQALDVVERINKGQADIGELRHHLNAVYNEDILSSGQSVQQLAFAKDPQASEVPVIASNAANADSKMASSNSPAEAQKQEQKAAMERYLAQEGKSRKDFDNDPTKTDKERQEEALRRKREDDALATWMTKPGNADLATLLIAAIAMFVGQSNPEMAARMDALVSRIFDNVENNSRGNGYSTPKSWDKDGNKTEATASRRAPKDYTPPKIDSEELRRQAEGLMNGESGRVVQVDGRAVNIAMDQLAKQYEGTQDPSKPAMVFDLGHITYDNPHQQGAVGINGVSEVPPSFEQIRIAAAQAAASGWAVYFTCTDSAVRAGNNGNASDIGPRGEYGRSIIDGTHGGRGIFVSWHQNKVGYESANGFCVMAKEDSAGHRLGMDIHANLRAMGAIKPGNEPDNALRDRGVYTDRVVGLTRDRGSDYPKIIMETGFLGNNHDINFITDKAYLERVVTGTNIACNNYAKALGWNLQPAVQQAAAKQEADKAVDAPKEKGDEPAKQPSGTPVTTPVKKPLFGNPESDPVVSLDSEKLDKVAAEMGKPKSSSEEKADPSIPASALAQIESDKTTQIG